MPPTSLRAAWHALDDGRHRSEFYRMWRAGFSAGLTHPGILTTMGKRESAATEEIRAWLLAGTTRGTDLATLVREGGTRFEEFERSLITLGEESGRLDEVLRVLADFYAGKHRLMLSVKKQMAYPVFSAFAASVIAPLPLLFLVGPWAYALSAGPAVLLIVFASGGVLAGVAMAYGRKPPLVRARLARALATGIEAGLPLPRAVRLAADASADPGIVSFVNRVGERRLATMPIAELLAGCPHMTVELRAVINTAEVTGDFSPLARLAEMYEAGFR